jgi:hypothetical protein
MFSFRNKTVSLNQELENRYLSSFLSHFPDNLSRSQDSGQELTLKNSGKITDNLAYAKD